MVEQKEKITLDDIFNNQEKAIKLFSDGDVEEIEFKDLTAKIEKGVLNTPYQYKNHPQQLLSGFLKIDWKGQEYELPFVADSNPNGFLYLSRILAVQSSGEKKNLSGVIRYSKTYNDLQLDNHSPAPLGQIGEGDNDVYKRYPFIVEILDIK